MVYGNDDNEEDKIRKEIELLETEVKQLEEPISDENDDPIDLQSFGEFDQLIYDILNENSQTGKDNNDSQDSDIIEEYEIINGKKIIISKELKTVQKSQVSQIQIENVLRFNGITVFPISNDPTKQFLGLRFDVFNRYLSRFTKSHYIILKQIDVITNRGSIKVQESSSNTATTTNDQKWTIFQTTIPKFIPINEIFNKYLQSVNTHHQSNTNVPPNFNKINKFSMHIYEHLCQMEDRKSLGLQLRDKYTTQSIKVSFDISATKITVKDGTHCTVIVRYNPESQSYTVYDKNDPNTTKTLSNQDDVHVAVSRFLNIDNDKHHSKRSKKRKTVHV